MRKYLIALPLAAAALAVAACGPNSSTTSVKAAASSVIANPTVSADLNVEETLLLNNLQHNFDAMHPVTSVQTAVRLTFPKGNTAKIESYAVKTFTLPVLHTKGAGSVRDNWLMGVVAYAQSAQGAGPSASPSGMSS